MMLFIRDLSKSFEYIDLNTKLRTKAKNDFEKTSLNL